MLLSTGVIGKALLNTVMGMGTVFIVLIFIAWVISLFKYINRPAKQAEKKEAQVVNNVVTQMEEPKELSGDSQLVAVITAAIMASMGEETPADGLVVRSIKRAKTNKWQRA